MMVDFFLNLIKVNEGIDYAFWISICVAYFFIIWFIVCIWVFSDARRRYESTITCVLFFIFTILFGPPALIFYIMIRPEHTLEEDYLINLALSGEKELKPIYFDGEHGFDISINLSVQPKSGAQDEHKMNMSVQWMPQQGTPRLQTKQIEVTEVLEDEQHKETIVRKSIFAKFSESVGNLSASVQNKMKSIKKPKKKENVNEKKNKEENINEQSNLQRVAREGESVSKKKKKRKKKKRR